MNGGAGGPPSCPFLLAGGTIWYPLLWGSAFPGLGLPSCVTECAERGGRGAWPTALEAGSVVADGGLRVMDRSSPADLMCLLAGFLILIIRPCGAPALSSASAHIPIPVPPSPVGRWVESHSSASFPSGLVGGTPSPSPLCQWVGGWNPVWTS